MKMFITWGLVCFLLFITAAHMYLLFVLDVSIAPVQPPCTAEVHLVSYADGPEVFKQNQKYLVFSSVNRGIDHFHMYQRQHLDKDFVEENKEILGQKKGAGYWLWKPYVILKTLKRVPENSIVLYIDSGICLKCHAQYFIDLLGSQDMLFFNWDHYKEQPNHFLYQPTVAHIAQKRTLEIMGCGSEDCMSSPNVWAGMGVYRNTAVTRAFVKRWLEACQNPEAITEVASSSQDTRYRSHAHDQAILSILHAKHSDGIGVLPVSSIWGNVIVWHHRHPEQKNQSLLFSAYKVPGILRKMCKGISFVIKSVIN